MKTRNFTIVTTVALALLASGAYTTFRVSAGTELSAAEESLIWGSAACEVCWAGTGDCDDDTTTCLNLNDGATCQVCPSAGDKRCKSATDNGCTDTSTNCPSGYFGTCTTGVCSNDSPWNCETRLDCYDW